MSHGKWEDGLLRDVALVLVSVVLSMSGVLALGFVAVTCAGEER